jgi:hypothetical protein
MASCDGRSVSFALGLALAVALGCGKATLAGADGSSLHDAAIVDAAAPEARSDGPVATAGLDAGADGAVNRFPCTDPQPLIPDAATGYERCAAGQLHRTAVQACPARTPVACSATNPSPDGGPTCATDSDCTALPGGECLYYGPIPSQPGSVGNPHDSCGCVYGGCFSDADCDAGRVCLCGDNQGGTCVAASCRSDADRRVGFLCTSSSNKNPCSPRDSFTCQTPADECGGDDDCLSGYSACVGLEERRQCVPISCSA